MTSKEFEKYMTSDYNTRCCGGKPKRVGRAHIICDKCEKDITIELTVLYQVMTDDN